MYYYNYRHLNSCDSVASSGFGSWITIFFHKEFMETHPDVLPFMLTSTYGSQQVGARVAHWDHPHHGALSCHGCRIHSSLSDSAVRWRRVSLEAWGGSRWRRRRRGRWCTWWGVGGGGYVVGRGRRRGGGVGTGEGRGGRGDSGCGGRGCGGVEGGLGGGDSWGRRRGGWWDVVFWDGGRLAARGGGEKICCLLIGIHNWISFQFKTIKKETKWRLLAELN